MVSNKEDKNKETDLLYQESEFIETNMSFYSFQDFKRNSIFLRTIYTQKGFRTKKLYKWYVYSRPMSMKQKDYVWDFLNGAWNFDNEN